MRLPSVSTAVCPGLETWRSKPLRSSQPWKSAGVPLASSTMPGTLSRNPETWFATGSASSSPSPTSPVTSTRNTVATAAPRGKRARRSSVTNGLSSSAISPATMNSSSTGPAARATAHRPSSASGSTTSWIQRGTTTGATLAGGSGTGGVTGMGASSTASGTCSSVSTSGPDIAVQYETQGGRTGSVQRVAAILFVGDIVASAGRRALRELLPGLREEHALDFVVVNGENASGGIGITPKHADELFAAGVDVITLGNHTYRHREVWPYLDEQRFILRPANFLPTQPGRGTCVFERDDGATLGVVNLSGNLFMQAASPAFAMVDEALREVSGADHVLVDMHAEATSEKVAMGWFLDGRATAVVGTHTHVPTADARVLPGGTAYVTDVGMTGARGGVIGVVREQAIESLRTQMSVRFEPSDEDPWVNAVVVRASSAGRADAIDQVLVPYRPSTATSSGPSSQDR